MKTHKIIIFITLFFFCSCTPSYSGDDKELERISVEVDKLSIHVGEKAQITVIAHYKDGTKQDVTKASFGTKYSSLYFFNPFSTSDSDIDSNGQIEGIALDDGSTSGIESFKISHRGKTEIIAITLYPDSAIRIEAEKTKIDVGESVQLKVWRKKTDGSRVDITNHKSGIRYRTIYKEVATVSKDGLVKGVGEFREKSHTVTIYVRNEDDRDSIRFIVKK